jgi:hypothetical protein
VSASIQDQVVALAKPQLESPASLAPFSATLTEKQKPTSFKEATVAEFNLEEAKAEASKIVELFADGFQWTDIFKVVPMVMETVEKVSGMSGEEKKASALTIINYVIDETDMPWIPDSLIDPLLKKAAPVLIELLVSATKGELGVNKSS